MSNVIINGVELELNLLDADVVDKFENLNEEIVKKIKNPKAYEGLSLADGLRFQCKLVNEYFDKLFGAGTADNVFPKNNDLSVRMDAFAKVCNMSNDVDSQIIEISSKYSPERADNRAQRRKKNKKKYNAVQHR